MDLEEFYKFISNGIDCMHIYTIICSTCTVSTFDLLFKSKVLADCIGDGHSLVSMLFDQRSLLALIAKKICLTKLEIADKINYELEDVLLKQTTFPMVVTLSFRFNNLEEKES